MIRYQMGKARHAANTFSVYRDKDPKSYRFYLQDFNQNNPNVVGEEESSYTVTSAADFNEA